MPPRPTMSAGALQRALRVLLWKIEGYNLGLYEPTDEEWELAVEITTWYETRKDQ